MFYCFRVCFLIPGQCKRCGWRHLSDREIEEEFKQIIEIWHVPQCLCSLAKEIGLWLDRWSLKIRPLRLFTRAERERECANVFFLSLWEPLWLDWRHSSALTSSGSCFWGQGASCQNAVRYYNNRFSVLSLRVLTSIVTHSRCVRVCIGAPVRGGGCVGV